MTKFFYPQTCVANIRVIFLSIVPRFAIVNADKPTGRASLFLGSLESVPLPSKNGQDRRTRRALPQWTGLIRSVATISFPIKKFHWRKKIEIKYKSREFRKPKKNVINTCLRRRDVFFLSCSIYFELRILPFIIQATGERKMKKTEWLYVTCLHTKPREPLTPSSFASASVNIASTFKIDNSSKDNPCRWETRMQSVSI